jgi:hypothetical protein
MTGSSAYQSTPRYDLSFLTLKSVKARYAGININLSPSPICIKMLIYALDYNTLRQDVRYPYVLHLIYSNERHRGHPFEESDCPAFSLDWQTAYLCAKFLNRTFQLF